MKKELKTEDQLKRGTEVCVRICTDINFVTTLKGNSSIVRLVSEDSKYIVS